MKSRLVFSGRLLLSMELDYNSMYVQFFKESVYRIAFVKDLQATYEKLRKKPRAALFQMKDLFTTSRASLFWESVISALRK